MASHPIFAAVFHGKTDKVRRLLDGDRTLVAQRNAKDLTPLHVAASRGQADAAQLLLEYGANVEGPTANDEWTPLVFAAYRGHLEVAKVLIDNDAGVTAADGNPIHFAGQRKHKDVCRLLVESGALEGLVDSTDLDVLHLFRAAYSYDWEVAKELLTRRPEMVDLKDRHGRTPLHEACTNGDTKTVRVLLKFGADLAIADDQGQTPLQRAEAHRQRSVIKLLQKHL